jgi:predicted RNA-binding protein YlxR (DUF448 family)
MLPDFYVFTFILILFIEEDKSRGAWVMQNVETVPKQKFKSKFQFMSLTPDW